MDKVAKHNEILEKNLKPIKEKDIDKVFKVKPLQEGKVWVVKHEGREYRNPNKKALLRDIATINKYKIK